MKGKLVDGEIYIFFFFSFFCVTGVASLVKPFMVNPNTERMAWSD